MLVLAVWKLAYLQNCNETFIYFFSALYESHDQPDVATGRKDEEKDRKWQEDDVFKDLPREQTYSRVI